MVGAGGHGKVVADILICQGIAVRGFLDDASATWGSTRLGLPILGPVAAYADYAPDGLALGVGANAIRRQIVTQLDCGAADLWRAAIHPRAVVAASARLGIGAVIMAGAVINPDTVLGDHVIINTGASVDHDCLIGDYVHLAPGVHLSGGVRVGAGTLVGVGGAIAPGRTVGAWTTVGAGAVVVRDIPDGVTAKGVPARWPVTREA